MPRAVRRAPGSRNVRRRRSVRRAPPALRTTLRPGIGAGKFVTIHGTPLVDATILEMAIATIAVPILTPREGEPRCF
jgi:hypothetical protein